MYDWQLFWYLHTIIMHTFGLYTLALSPCFLSPLAESLLLSFWIPFYLLGNPPSVTGSIHLGLRLLVDWPPLSQPLPIPPHSKFPEPRLISASLQRPQESGFLCPEHLLKVERFHKVERPLKTSAPCHQDGVPVLGAGVPVPRHHQRRQHHHSGCSNRGDFHILI